MNKKKKKKKKQTSICESLSTKHPPDNVSPDFYCYFIVNIHFKKNIFQRLSRKKRRKTNQYRTVSLGMTNGSVRTLFIEFVVEDADVLPREKSDSRPKQVLKGKYPRVFADHFL